MFAYLIVYFIYKNWYAQTLFEMAVQEVKYGGLLLHGEQLIMPTYTWLRWLC